MMIDSIEIQLMRELVDVQTARSANWPNPYAPADKDLESIHRAKIASIKKQLSARRVAVPETTPAVGAPISCEPEGLRAPRRATFFRRFMRRIGKNASVVLPGDHGGQNSTKDVLAG